MMDGKELLLTTLNQRYERYVEERTRCKAEFSEEAVHDLRVAVRRMLATIQVLRAVLPMPQLKKLQQNFKSQLDSLDGLRDTQVMLVEMEETLETLPELAALQISLIKRERRLLGKAEQDVRAIKTGAIGRGLELARASLEEISASRELDENLLEVLDELHQTVRQRLGRVDPTQPASIHRVRVAFKKFRYTIEILHPLLPGFPQAQFKSMHHYQTAMGEIQDAEVLLEMIADYGARHKHYDPAPARSHYTHILNERINAFIENMNECVTFWRESPGRAFPWQTPGSEPK